MNIVDELQTIEKDMIWSKVVVGNKDVSVSKLIEHLDNADWVNTGRSYIEENGICPFCQQKTQQAGRGYVFICSKQLTEKEGVTEKRGAENQMEWVGRFSFCSGKIGC